MQVTGCQWQLEPLLDLRETRGGLIGGIAAACMCGERRVYAVNRRWGCEVSEMFGLG